MADSSMLAAILSGQDPLAGQMLGGYQGAQLSNAALDPNFGHNEGPFGALAKTLAGVRGSGMTNDAVNAVVQARIAAQPELAKLYGSPDPYAELGKNPDAYSPLARAMVLNATPEQVAQSRLASANAAYTGLNVAGFQNAQPAGAIGAPAAKMAPPATGPAANVRPPTGDVSVLGTGPQAGRYPSAAAAGDAAATDPIIAAASATPQQKAAMMQDPQKRLQIMQRLRVLEAAAQRARAAASQPGAGNAAQPPT